MRGLGRRLLVLVLCAFPCARLIAHVRLIHPGNGSPLRWNAPATVGIVINSAGSGDIQDGSHETALRLAIQDWNAAQGTSATLVEDASAASQARTDYTSTGVHLILFDETNSSGFFPGGSATVALTPIWFSSNGAIQDADVLFNGAGFAFTTSGVPGRFDVQDVAAHELGHLVGLDHSGATGATMFPYVDQGLILQRSLSQDELAGLRDAYPAGAFGQITGTVVRASDGSSVAGAYLVARDAEGRTRASILANVNGVFSLRGLEPGTYTVYARPLDSTVDEDNLSSGYSGKIDTDFEPAFFGAPVAVSGSSAAALGTLAVASDVSLTLGTAADALPIRAIAGQSRTVFLHGNGLFTGSTLEASDLDLILGLPVWQGTQVSFQLTVPAGEARGHVDFQVTNASGRIAILPAALEITPPSPSVSAVVPDTGTTNGGDALTLTGASFAAGARVVIGERIYTDGVDATVVDAGTLTLTTAATGVGVHDVVVIDSSGVEGRLTAGFHALSAPSLERALPGAGDFSGGTAVVLAGAGFVEGMSVRIDGLDQGPTMVESPTLARFTTQGGSEGGPYLLELENPDGALASQAFSYVDQSDPAFASLAPTEGPAGGGSLLTLRGAGFTPSMSVWFYSDPAADPVQAASVTFVDDSSLEVMTPAHAAGVVSVLVADANQSGVFAESAFTFNGSSGGGGGGCHTLPFSGPRGPRAWRDGAGWLVLLFGWLGWRARALQATRVEARAALRP